MGIPEYKTEEYRWRNCRVCNANGWTLEQHKNHKESTTVEMQNTRIAQLERKLKVAREALEFYASTMPVATWQENVVMNAPAQDGGKRARAALKELEEGTWER